MKFCHHKKNKPAWKDLMLLVVIVTASAMISPTVLRAQSFRVYRIDIWDNETRGPLDGHLKNITVFDALSNLVTGNVYYNAQTYSTTHYFPMDIEVNEKSTIQVQSKGYQTLKRTPDGSAFSLVPKIECGDANRVCSPGTETILNCPSDCATCGDQICTFPYENALTCPSDCRKFKRGDANRNGVVDSNDASAIFNWYYYHTPVACMDAADADDNGSVTPEDAYKILYYKYSIPAPGTYAQGYDPTNDLLTCDR